MKRHTLRLLGALGLLTATPARGAPPPTHAEPPAQTFRVGTLNAWGLPFPIAPNRKGRLPAIASFLEKGGFDVVGLQEIWGGARRHLILDGLLVPSRRASGDSGLALMSRHPATTPVVTSFQRASGPDALKKKGVLTSRVEVGAGRHLWSVVTHLQAGGGERQATVRQHQIDTLLHVLAGLDGPAIVVGDFNFYDRPEDRDSEARLEAAGLIDAAARLGETTPTYARSGHRFDRVFVRGTEQVRLDSVSAHVYRYEDPRDILSDHRPVQVELSWVTLD